MIRLDNVCKDYVNVKVIKNLNICLPNKGLIGIVGPSGSGKSTLLNLISSLDTPTSGNIYFNDVDITKYNKKELLQYRKNIGFVFQDFFLIDELTVYENIKLALDIEGNKNEEKINEVLNKLHIYEIKDKYPNKISGGEKQRVAIARALVKDVNILIADEPTGNLDYTNSKNIYEMLKEISNDILVIMSTHDEEAKGYCDNLVEFKKDIIETNLCDYYIDNEDIKQKKSSILSIFYNSMLFMKKKKLKIFWITFLFSLIFGITLFLINLAFINDIELKYKIYKNANVEYVEEKFFKDELLDNKTKKDDFEYYYRQKEKFDKLDVSFYIASEGHNDYKCNNRTITVKDTRIDDTRGFRLHNNNELIGDSIIVSDYFLYLAYGQVDFDLIEDKKVYYKDYELNIIDYYITNYEEKLNNRYSDFDKFEYLSCIISENTFNNINLFLYDYIYQNKYEYNDLFICNKTGFVKDIIYGNYPINSNEIVISKAIFKSTFNEEPNDINYNKKYIFNVNNEEYIIVGISNGLYEFLFSDSEFSKIKEEYRPLLLDSVCVNKYIKYYLDDYNQTIELLKEEKTSGNELISNVREYLLSLNIIISFCSKYIYFFIAIMILFAIFILHLLTTDLLENNKKEIAIIYSLGGNRLYISMIFIIQNILILFMSSLIGFVICILLNSVVNKYVIQLIFEIIEDGCNALSININVSLCFVGIIFIILVIAIFTSIFKIGKNKVIDVLYNRV